MWKFMENRVYNAAVKGDVNMFCNAADQERFHQKTSQENNIIHVAAQHEQYNFIQAALNSLPKLTCESLLCEQNSEGNTPLHIAAEFGDEAVIKQICEYSDQWKSPPWRVVNLEGNTPAHVALLYGNVSVAKYLVGNDGYLAQICNNFKETLLHLAIQYHVHDDYEFQIAEMQGKSSHKKVHKSTDDLSPIIDLLLKEDSSVACWADNQGSTPLHKATSLGPLFCLRVIKAVLASCPQAAQVHDQHSGQTVLHLLTNHQVPSYEEAVALLNIPEVYALRNRKNHEGDTPLHVAARNNDSNMVRALLGSSVKLTIKDQNGVAAGSLLRQFNAASPDQMRNTETLVEWRRKLTEEECEAAKKADVSFLNRRLNSVGMHQFLVSQTPKGGNILHILMHCKFNEDMNETEEFIAEAIRKCPLLLTEKDIKGNTPIHVLAKNKGSFRLLDLSYNYFQKAREEAGDARGALFCPPWRIKNVKGDTPLHAAAKAGCFEAARKLAELDKEVAGYVNNRNETPLHLICHFKRVLSTSFRKDELYHSLDGLTSSFIKGNAGLPYMKDEDGLTPLLIAVQNLNFAMIEILHLSYPECTKMTDLKGRTLWHMFVYRPINVFRVPFDNFDYVGATTNIFSQGYNHHVTDLITRQDNDGNTPLHLAIANRRFDYAQFFLSYGAITRRIKRHQWREFLEIENDDGVSTYDLIGSAEHLPREFEKFLWKQGNLLFGYRSLYGVPTTKIQDYANTIGVTAALLTTITFTAAFTVPGGLDSSNGTPLLLREAMFQVFIISDVVAMCSSMMVLFCLLWIMTTSHKRESLLLLDVSVYLLQTSFHATLTTFMTGLYVSTVPIVPGIAFFSCFACSLLILMMHKSFVMVSVAPFSGFLIVWSRVIREYVRHHMTSAWSSLLAFFGFM